MAAGPHFHCGEGPKARTLLTVSLSEGPHICARFPAAFVRRHAERARTNAMRRGFCLLGLRRVRVLLSRVVHRKHGELQQLRGPMHSLS